MIISHLVARSANNIIGSNNDLPWSLADDLLHFKAYTLGKPIVMGRKTYESIGRPLPNRKSIVISSKVLEPKENLLVCGSIDDGLNKARQLFSDEIIIIGGGQIFQSTINLVNKLVITEVACNIDGDISYPSIDLADWNTRLLAEFRKNESNQYAFKIIEYIKKI